jgi:hypothetical protein
MEETSILTDSGEGSLVRVGSEMEETSILTDSGEGRRAQGEGEVGE